jgi:hypothetical protein
MAWKRQVWSKGTLLTCFESGRKSKAARRSAKRYALDELRYERRLGGKVTLRRVRAIVNGKKRILHCLFRLR